MKFEKSLDKIKRLYKIAEKEVSQLSLAPAT